MTDPTLATNGMPESAPAGLGDKLGGFFNAEDPTQAGLGQTSHNWRDRINYAGRRSRVAQLQRRRGDEPDDDGGPRY